MGLLHVRYVLVWLRALISVHLGFFRVDIDRNGFVEKKEMKKIMDVRLMFRLSDAC